MTETSNLSTILLGVAVLVAVILIVSLIVWAIKSRKGSTPPAVPPVVAPPVDEDGEPPAEEKVAEPRGPPAPSPAPVVVEEIAEEVPEPAATRMERLRARLARSGAIGNALLAVLSRGDLNESDWEEIEDTLLVADVGLPAAEQIMDSLRTRMRVQGSQDPAEAKQVLREELLALVGEDMERDLALTGEGENPAAVLVVGVNGTGKTTTVGKLGRLLRAEDKTVLMGAADTFRAAAAEQLTTWGDRVGVEVVRSDKEGADPASVAFEAVARAKETGTDVVLVDTAGRLQTKSTLMEELGKVKRVMEKQAPVTEVLLVLDATTGQNGLRQAEVFAQAVGITGIVLTKLDGSAKGGIVISVQKELGVPVKLVGLGEGPDDLAPFDPAAFVDAILGDE